LNEGIGSEQLLINTIVQWNESRQRVGIMTVIGERHMSHNTGCDRRPFLSAAMAAFGTTGLVASDGLDPSAAELDIDHTDRASK
jgi:hypothetical protein